MTLDQQSSSARSTASTSSYRRSMLLFDDQAGVSMGVPELIIGTTAGADEGRERFQVDSRAERCCRPTMAPAWL